ncbi:Mbov_0400 family ICE element protein [Mycoplasmopsis columboralis]|uniref:Uncharacterized protein n=1 Tax=Mycoplasmopsis columboralis TaxID=171282 RepID=A0A449B5M3_9BACT|nr:hypothetical protein [Mycoplasmopsis columboralis]VEU75869.1 Uncharacterised protein [Mycoplasmopsis columboralis]
MINKVWKREFNKISKGIDTISFDKYGNQILKYDNFNNKNWNNCRPLIVFHYGEYTFYLNMRSAKKDRKQLPFEYEIQNKNNTNNDWVDTSNIMVMNTEEFDLLYSEKDYEEINSLSLFDAKQIMSMVINNFTQDSIDYDLTFQKVEINKETMQPESKIILSTLNFKAYKMLDYMESFPYNESLWYIFEDLKNASDEEFLEYIHNNKNDWDLIKNRYRSEILEPSEEESKNNAKKEKQVIVM